MWQPSVNFPSVPLPKPRFEQIRPHAFNFAVQREELNYQVRNRGRVRTFGSGYPELAIQEALDSLSNNRKQKEKVKLLKNFNSIDNAIQIPDHTHFVLEGQITLASGEDNNILENKDATACDVTIEGGVLNAIDAGGSMAAIYWHQTAECGYHYRECIIKNMKIFAIDYITPQDMAGIYIDPSGGLTEYPIIPQLHNIVSYGHHYGAYLNCTDSIFSNLLLHAPLAPYSGAALYMYGGAANNFENIRCDGRLYCYATQISNFNTITVDVWSEEMDAITLDGTQGVNINGAVLTIGSTTSTNAKAGILLKKRGTSDIRQYSIYNTVSHVYVGRRGYFTDAHRFKYGIKEDESSSYVDYNIFDDISAQDTTDGNLKQGAHSKIDNSLP